MTPTILPNGTLTAEEQRVIEQLRQLPSGAVADLGEYLELLALREANPGTPDETSPAETAAALASEPFRRIMHKLPPARAVLILEFATFVAGKCLTWRYEDPASLEVATALMGLDPFLRRENETINREFACTMNDGLEPY